MELSYIRQGGCAVAELTGPEPVLTDAQSALELAMTARYAAGADHLLVDQAAVAEDFFILSTGLAGEILQKFTNYGVKCAVFGDFSGCTSKPLQDFIRESNRGSGVFFTASREEAVERLTGGARA